MASIKDSPCMNCEYHGCGAYHDECPEYLEYSTQIRTINHNRRTKKINTWRNGYEKCDFGKKSKYKSKVIKSHKK